MSERSETTMDGRARRAADLAAVIEERGFACFPRAGWDDSREQAGLEEARLRLWQAIEDLVDGGRDVDFVELDPGDGPAHYLWFASDPPDWWIENRPAEPE